MKEVTFKNVKCKTGGMIPRKGDARTSMLSLPNQERKVDDHCYLLEAIWIDLNLNKDAIMKLGKAKEVADTLRDEVVERKMLGPAVVQRTKDMIDLIRGRLVVAQDGHDKKDEVRKEMKAKSTNCWTLGYIKTYWEDSIGASPNPEHVADPSILKTSQSFLRLPSSTHHFKEGILAAEDFDYKELGSEKSGRDSSGNVWYEFWKETMYKGVNVNKPFVHGTGLRRRGCSCSKEDFLPEESFKSWGNYVSALKATPSRFVDRVFTRSADQAELETKARSHNKMKKTLSWWDLMWFGIRAVIGAEIFVLTGLEARYHADPSVVLSYIVYGISALLSVFCYTKFAVEIPVAGGSFAYLRVELGKFVAFIAVGNIILEYIIGGAAVTRSWTSYLATLCNQDLDDFHIYASALADDYNHLDPVAIGIIIILDKQFEKFLEVFKKLHINIPFAEALEQMPSYARLMKGASINLMPFSIFKKLGLPDPTLTYMSLQLADRSIAYPRGIVEDVLVKVHKLIFPADFVILDFEEDKKIPVILGRPFLATGRTMIDVQKGELSMKVYDQKVTFNMFKEIKLPTTKEECFKVEWVDSVVNSELDQLPKSETLERSLIGKSVIDDKEGAEQLQVLNAPSWMRKLDIPFDSLGLAELKISQEHFELFIQEALTLELNRNPDHLSYSFLGAPHDVDRFGLGDEQYRRVTRRMEAMHDIHHRFAEDLTHAFAAVVRDTGGEVDWPPDSPPDEGDSPTNLAPGARLGCGAAAWELRRPPGELRRPPEVRLVAYFAEKGFSEWNLTILRVQIKDSNLKFLVSLPKYRKPMTVSLRNSQDHREFILERLYGILKTYELELEQDEQKLDSEKKKYKPVDYKKKYFELLKQKERAFLNQDNVWAADGVDEDEETSYINLALMAKSDEAKVETQFVEFEKLKIEFKIAKDELTESLKKEEIFRKHLERVQVVIKPWKSSRNVSAQIAKVQGIESFYEDSWKKSKEKLDSELVEGLSTDVESTYDEVYLSKDKSNYALKNKDAHSLKEQKPIRQAKLAILNGKNMDQFPRTLLQENQVKSRRIKESMWGIYK
ncbi:hypothetical protein AgCh_000967 [Apium graveolens]